MRGAAIRCKITKDMRASTGSVKTVLQKGKKDMSKRELIERFTSPGAEWRGKPFWSWNGELEKKELLRQASVIKEMGWGGHFMHSRSGLITEYLGDEWFELINAVADESERLGLESWLYDEDRWPSGSAGGKVTEDPRYRMKSLLLTEMPVERYRPRKEDFAVFVGIVNGENLWDYAPLAPGADAAEAAKALRTGGKSGELKALCFSVQPDPCSSNYNGTTYIDTMNAGATRRFIELTHEQYKKHCGGRLGTSIRGIFTDEPHRGHGMDDLAERDGVRTCRMAWTDDLFGEFQTRYGYDARPILPELFYFPRGTRVTPLKLHYFDLADNLFLERFAKPLHDWCAANGMLFTGHVLHEDSLSNQTVPHGSLMRFYQYMDVPGVDVLTEGNRCYWIVKQLASTARQTGRNRMLSELYGCTGWQFDFHGHKAVGDWQALFGINVRCPHLSWYTMEGQSKRDYPASLLSQSAWYRDYPLVEDYFARFGVVMSDAAPLCDVLVLNPIESVWCQTHLGWAKWIMNVDPEIEKLEADYEKMFRLLTGHHIDFDYGEEQMMAETARVEKEEGGRAVLQVGKMRYRTVVVGGMLTMRPSTLALLREFAAAGGRIVFAGPAPAYVDARESGEVRELAARCVQTALSEDGLVPAVRSGSSFRVEVDTEADGTCAQDVFVQVRRRAEDDALVVALLNTDREAPRSRLAVRLLLPEGFSAEEWDLTDGSRYDASGCCTRGHGETVLHTSLAAGGTRVFVLTRSPEPLPVRPAPAEAESLPVPARPMRYRLDEPNPCVLDFARWRWEGGEWHGEKEVLKADDEIRDGLGLERRGGEMLQPWYSKLHRQEEFGTLELEYDFNVETLPEGPVFLAAERPERMAYALNGTPLSCPDGGDFWVDICFKKFPVPAGVLKKGRNTVTVRTVFTRNTNVEALYLLGGFGVELAGKRRTLTALPGKIGFGDLARYGLPFYTGCVTYLLEPEVYRSLRGKEGSVWLSPTGFTGALVRVETPEGVKRLGWEPFEADVTEAVRRGETIGLTVVGTRRNTFGPLHQVPALDIAYGPANFVTEGEHWSDGYVLVGSGAEGAVFKRKK